MTRPLTKASPKVQLELQPMEPPAPLELPDSRRWIIAPHGDILHLFTSVVFTKDPKKAEVDSFLQAQLDAGKLQIHTD